MEEKSPSHNQIMRLAALGTPKAAMLGLTLRWDRQKERAGEAMARYISLPVLKHLECVRTFLIVFATYSYSIITHHYHHVP